MSIDVGHVIAGKYRLVRLIGRGSMGEVWTAHHQSLDERVAVKLLTPPSENDELVESGANAAARFRNEAQLAAKLSRKTRHIVRVTDHGEEEGLAYLVMELLEGETLDAMLERDRRLPLPLLSGIVGQIGRALTQAHAEGVAHRDLKPANVFLTHDEDGKLLVKLLDFGIARAIHAHRAPEGAAFATAKGLVFGTPSYMSPEQARASGKLDRRCDLWALGVIAYEGATGDLPMDGKDVDELLRNVCAGRLVPASRRSPDLGDRLDAFFDKALHEDIEHRFQSAAELAQAFARSAGAPIEAPVSSPSLPRIDLPQADDSSEMPTLSPPPAWRTRKGLIATGAVLVACAALGAAWKAMSGTTSSAQAAPSATSAVSGPTPSGIATTLAVVPPSAIPPAAPDVPSIAASALPRATGRSSLPASPTPVAPVVTGAPTAPSPAPIPTTTTPPTPAPALAPTPAKDKSEVF
jgi:serine/threonine-protein kinase